VVDHDLEVGQFTGEPRHYSQLVARGLDGGHDAVAGHQREVLHHGRLLEQRRLVLGASHQSRRNPHPDAPYKRNPAKTFD
jgi:hypothetical protein